MIVCLDPGHGGKDPGAVKQGIKEEQINLAIANLVMAKLIKLKHTVVITRGNLPPTEKMLNLARCKKSNDAKAQAFVAIHCNSARLSTAHGHEVIHSPGSLRGRKLAKAVSVSLSSVIEPRLRPILTDEDTGRGPYTVLRKTFAPAIIVECGFLSNDADREKLQRQRPAIADAIASGIDNYSKEV